MNQDDGDQHARDYYRRKTARRERDVDLLVDVAVFLAFVMVFAKLVGLLCEYCSSLF